MAHYALLKPDSAIVACVFVGPGESAQAPHAKTWEHFFTETEGMRCIQTSYNTRGGVHYDPETGEPSTDQSKALRFNYAGIGYTYDEARDAFIPPKPFDSWILNEETCLWEAPIPYPNDGLVYSWDEVSGDWIEVVEPSA